MFLNFGMVGILKPKIFFVWKTFGPKKRDPVRLVRYSYNL